MKIGFRKPSLKKSFKARTTGALKRKVKKALIPGYGKKGMGWIKNPKKAAYNKVYHKTTVDTLAPLKKGTNSKSVQYNQASENVSCRAPNTEGTYNSIIMPSNDNKSIIKICKKCGVKNDSAETECKVCGNQEFNTVCTSCGAVIEGEICPYCNNSIDKQRVCPLCGAAFYGEVCPDCGSKYKEISKKEMNNTLKTVLWVLGWIFCFPIPLTILLLKNKNFSQTLKIVVIVIAWLAYLMIISAIATKGQVFEKLNENSSRNSSTEQTDSTPEKIKIESLSFTSSSEVFEYVKGDTFEIKVKVEPETAETNDVLVVLSDDKIAKVEETTIKKNWLSAELTVKLRAIECGETEIYVASRDRSIKTDTKSVSVFSMGKITISCIGLYEYEVGNTAYATVSISSTGLKREDVDISSSNSNVAINDIVFSEENGKTNISFDIIAKKAGDTVITVKSANGDRQDTLEIHVDPKDTSRTVYTTPNGDKYHYSKDCAGEHARATTLNKAKKLGYGPCSKCVK